MQFMKLLQQKNSSIHEINMTTQPTAMQTLYNRL